MSCIGHILCMEKYNKHTHTNCEYKILTLIGQRY